MRENATRFTDVILAIDAVNAEDLNLVGVDGKKLPAEFNFSEGTSH